MFEEDDEDLDIDYSGTDTRPYLDTKDMFDGNRKHIRKHPLATGPGRSFSSKTECSLALHDGRYLKDYFHTILGEPGYITRVGKKVKSVKNGNHCCWNVYR